MDVCVRVPRLAVDRPFTYLLPEQPRAGTGSLVSVPFHGRTVHGWVLGRASEPPPGRLLPVRSVRSPVRFFDPAMLELLRWVAGRYLAPLATVIERSHPPRVASEEGAEPGPAPPFPVPPAPVEAPPPPGPAVPGPLDGYGGAASLLLPGTTTWLRPLPGEESSSCVAAVGACLARGRSAVVIVPEADPLPDTAASVLHAFGHRAVAFLGGDGRERYRRWLDIRAGRHDVVVGTRPAVFAPVGRVGLVWIGREVHPGHREDRSPYYHVREVASARAAIEGAACVVASLSPSVETIVAVREGRFRVARPPRAVERAAAPLVETTPPEAEDRSPRLASLLKRVRSAALIVSRRGYGVARVCRRCGAAAACVACRGPLVVSRGVPTCRVCGAQAVCASCGSDRFGVERGGAERIAEWARRAASVEVILSEAGRVAGPGQGRILVGTAAAVNDVGPVRVDVVGILDPDRALVRAGVHAPEQALATWMEAAAWAGPRAGGGRVLVQTRRSGHPAVQALVRWEPVPFLLAEADGRTSAGFPPGHPVFRVTGSSGLEAALWTAGATTVLATPVETGTICLVAVAPDHLGRFRADVVRLAAGGDVIRVEAEPQL